MPVTESEILQNVVSLLPSNSLTLRYLRYAAGSTDAPLVFHLGGALHLLTAIAPIDYYFPLGDEIYANLFTLLIGTSRSARKSSSIQLSRKITSGAIPASICETPGSREGLIESVRANPRHTIFYEEFGDFLASTTEGYLAAIKMAYNSLFDCAPLGRSLANKKLGVVNNPRISVFGGVAQTYLEELTSGADWMGGFFSRFLLLMGVRERRYEAPPINMVLRAELIEEVRQRELDVRGEFKPGRCLGFDDRARGRWAAFFYELAELKAPSRISGAVGGLQTIALKIALLLALDYGGGRTSKGAPWKITMAELQPALEISLYHLRTAYELADTLALSTYLQERRRILDSIDDVEGSTRGQIIALSKLPKRTVVERLESMVEEGVVTNYAVAQDNGKGSVDQYRRQPREEQAVDRAIASVTRAVAVNRVSQPGNNLTVDALLNGSFVTTPYTTAPSVSPSGEYLTLPPPLTLFPAEARAAAYQGEDNAGTFTNYSGEDPEDDEDN